MGPRIREDTGRGEKEGRRLQTGTLPACVGFRLFSLGGAMGDGSPHTRGHGEGDGGFANRLYERGEDGSPHTRGHWEGDGRFANRPYERGEDGSPHTRGHWEGREGGAPLANGDPSCLRWFSVIQFGRCDGGWVPASARTREEGRFYPHPFDKLRAGSSLPPSRGKGVDYSFGLVLIFDWVSVCA